MEEIELLGQVCTNSLFDQEGREGYLSFLVKESSCMPQGGRKGVCSVAITVQNLMD